MANPWFRMYAEFVHDPKVQRLSEVEQRRFVMLLCIRCSNGDVTLHDCDIAFQLRISDEEWSATKSVLISKNLIDGENKPTAWEKRQYASDSSAARVARHRELQKQKSNVDVTLQKRESNVLDTDTDTDTDIDIKAMAIGKPNCPHQEIINLYHEVLPASPRIKDWTPARAASLKARWNEGTDRQTLEYWRGLFEYIAGIPFLTGRTPGVNGRRPFVLSLDWLLKAENFAKVREGRYEDLAA